MDNMYEKIEFLCKEKGISITGLSKDTGISRSVFSELKAKRTKQLSNKHLPVVAEYFGVSVDYLLGGETEKTPAQKGERSIDDEDIKFALFGGAASDAQYEEVKRFARFIRERDCDDDTDG